ncbi:phage tail tape measure protein [Fusobacterium nucleatum]|uniref:phage tail tape measure protein n=1 Tax=Fusobacterium nucleatum TaxID=851 RepID=UPI0030CAF7A4
MEHVLSARLELKDKFTSVISKAEKGLAGLYQKAKSMNWEKVNSGLNKFGAVAIGGLAGIGAIAGSSLTAFADLEDQVRRNKAIMGATAVEENMLMAQTRELGRSTRFTAQEVAQAQMYQAMAGMKTNEVLELTPKLLKLSIASGEDLASTSDLLTDNISAFGLTLQDADRFMDVMAATANNTNTSIAQLGEAYKYVASTSKNFESLEETNIILGLLADSGLKGSIAGRNLAAIYARLSKTTPDMDKALKKVGVTLYDNNGKFKGLRKIIEELKPKLALMSEEQRNYFLATIAGTEGLKLMNNLLGTSKEGIEKAEKAILNATGATDKMSEEMGNTTKNKIAQFRSAVEDLKISIGEGLAPTAVDFINKFTDKMAELNSKGTFNTENVEAYFNRIFALTAEAIKGFAALKVAAMAENIFPGAGKYIAGGYLAYKAGKAVGDWAGEKIGRTKNKWELRKEYQDKGYTWDEANAQAEKDLETIDLRNSKTEDDSKIEYIKQRMLKEKLRDNKNSGKGIEQLMKETEEDFKERRRIAKLTPEELSKEQTIQKNKTVNSLNRPLGTVNISKNGEKTDLEKVSDKLGLKAPVSPLSTTFSPQVNVNMGGVVIKNEADIEKTAEMSKQKIMAELRNFVRVTK